MMVCKRWFVALLLSGVAAFVGGDRTHAQVTADTTLGTETSVINATTTGSNATYGITGGALRDTTLFHSFDQFSVPSGDTTLFLNADALTHIIGRVTGNNLSRLEGTIRAGGRANVFLINPAGIVFGPAAQLDIGGSFLASTGEGLRFDDGFVYGTRSPDAPPLLRVSAPTGLVLGNGSQAIEVIEPTLSVADGQTLALIGSEVVLTGAELNTVGGRVELGGVAEAGELSLSQTDAGWDVGLSSALSSALSGGDSREVTGQPNGQPNGQGAVRLLEQSVIDTSGPGGGAIELQGQTVRLAGQSALISDTLGGLNGDGIRVNAVDFSSEAGSFLGAATSGAGASSSIEITAADISIEGRSVEAFEVSQNLIFTGGRQLSDRQTGGFFTFTTGSGNSGAITLQGERIQLSEGASVSSETLGTGRSGDISITTTERIGLNGSGIYSQSLTRIPLQVERIFQTPTGLLSQGIPAGSAGNITLSTTELSVEDRSVISSSTLSDGNAGDLVIRATDSVVLQESVPVMFPSLPSLLANVSIGGNGSAGDTTIETGRLVIQRSLGIFSSTGLFTVPFGGPAGDINIVATDSVDIFSGFPGFFQSTIDLSSRSEAAAGSLNLTTPSLSIREGANIITATVNAGAGGAIQIGASDIVISGRGPGENGSVSGIFSTSGDFGPTVTSIPFIGGPATGNGGTITLTTQNLLVEDEASISVESSELGAAGNLNITAERILLADDGNLNASTATGAGGNIALIADSITLNDAQITAEATRDDGGNLALNLQEVLLLRNGSLISAEAGTAGAGGNGGDITLNSGFVVAVPTENSDIRANAFEGNGGNVNITARNLLGIAFRPDVLDTPESDITASSLFGRNGEVVITEINPEPPQADAELPVETAPPSVARGCRGQGAQTGSFVSSGRGGLPTSPVSPLSADELWQDIAPLNIENMGETVAVPVMTAPISGAISGPIVEAQQWRRDAEGTVTLFARSPQTAEHLTQAAACLASEAE
ncbi:MAG: filamentous hemagglutinin N-terminal domain-containing protein [Cyanobacteria bacterium J06598_3]